MRFGDSFGGHRGCQKMVGQQDNTIAIRHTMVVKHLQNQFLPVTAVELLRYLSTKDRCHLHLHQLWSPSLNQLKAVALVHLHHHHHHKKPKHVMCFKIRVPSSTLSQLQHLTDLMTSNDPLPAHHCSHDVWMASHHHWCQHHPQRLWAEWNAVYPYRQNCCAVKTG